MKRDDLPTKTCVHCGRAFVPQYTSMQVACSLRCAARLVKKQREDRERAEREQVKKRKEALKSRRQWIAEAQAAVNKYCRLRDLHAGRGCISCGAKPEQAFGGTMDAGHWRSVGSAPHMRFFTTQIRLQCVRCNRHLSGAAVEFRRGLVELLGVERVEQIEAMQGVAKWPVDYLRRLKGVMARKARRLEKKMEDKRA